jgi:hypothetical protein
LELEERVQKEAQLLGLEELATIQYSHQLLQPEEVAVVAK